mmetsp:Transcript_22998/g.56878  ORF Transcript_22998/g.56878 Transcript_22998/m.56878 type:complete len:270 (-) Transcript_22998:370-1179(-)
MMSLLLPRPEPSPLKIRPCCRRLSLGSSSRPTRCFFSTVVGFLKEVADRARACRSSPSRVSPSLGMLGPRSATAMFMCLERMWMLSPLPERAVRGRSMRLGIRSCRSRTALVSKRPAVRSLSFSSPGAAGEATLRTAITALGRSSIMACSSVSLMTVCLSLRKNLQKARLPAESVASQTTSVVSSRFSSTSPDLTPSTKVTLTSSPSTLSIAFGCSYWRSALWSPRETMISVLLGLQAVKRGDSWSTTWTVNLQVAALLEGSVATTCTG